MNPAGDAAFPAYHRLVELGGSDTDRVLDKLIASQIDPAFEILPRPLFDTIFEKLSVTLLRRSGVTGGIINLTPIT